MDAQEYKSRLNAILLKAGPILETCNLRDKALDIRERIVSVPMDKSSNVISLLGNIKDEIIALLNEALTRVQVTFVELEEPEKGDEEIFRKYMADLKNVKQDLSSPNSPTRREATSLLKRAKSNLLNELASQAIIFPTECLDTILACPEVHNSNGPQWVLTQINQGLSTLSEEVNIRILASFDAANEILGSKIEFLQNSCDHTINIGTHSHTSVSDDVYSLVRQSLPAIGIGGLSSTLVATLINPIAGVITGLAAGGLFIWKAYSSTSRQKKIMELKQQLAPKITLAMTELKSYVLECYEDFEEGLNDSIERVLANITAEMQKCAEALNSCEQEKREFDTRQNIINNQMMALETYIRQLDILMTNPFGGNI